MGELLLERLALTDVAAVQDDPADVLVVEQLRVLHLELEPASVLMAQGALERMRLGTRALGADDDLGQPRAVGMRNQPVETACPGSRRPGSRAGARSTGSDTRRRRELSSTVIRSLEWATSERKRASLFWRWRFSASEAASSASDTCEASASSEPKRSLDTGSGQSNTSAPCSTSWAARRTRSASSTAPSTSAASTDDWSVTISTGPEARAARREPVGVVVRQLPGAATARCCDACAVLVPEDETHLGRLTDQLARRSDDCVVDILVTAGGDEHDARLAKRRLAGSGALLLADEARHARHDEQEQDRRRRDDHEQVDAADVLGEVDPRSDQAGERKQREARRVRRARASGVGCSSAPHRRVKRSGAPQHEVGDPADVVDELVVVGPGEQRVVVGAVRGEQRDGARGEQIEGPASACPRPPPA